MATVNGAVAWFQKVLQTVRAVSSDRPPLMSNTMTSQKEHGHGFLKLPGEIRNEIYGYLLADCEVRIMMCEKLLGFLGIPWTDILRFLYSNTHRTFLRINRQIRMEVFSYMLHYCQFEIDLRSLQKYHQFYFDSRIGEIKNITIRMPDTNFKAMHIDKHCGLVTKTSDFKPIVDALSPLCKAGRLQRVVVTHDPCIFYRSNFLYDDDPRAIDRYMRPIEITERLRDELGSCVVGRDIQFEASGEW